MNDLDAAIERELADSDELTSYWKSVAATQVERAEAAERTVKDYEQHGGLTDDDIRELLAKVEHYEAALRELDQFQRLYEQNTRGNEMPGNSLYAGKLMAIVWHARVALNELPGSLAPRYSQGGHITHVCGMQGSEAL